MKRFYNYYDLCIESDVPLVMRECTDCCSEPQLTVTKGRPLLATGVEDASYKLSAHEVCVHTPDFRAIVSRDGRYVELSLVDGVAPAILTRTFAQRVMPLVMFFQGALQLHASVVSRGGLGICIFGEGGAGKSTLAAEFVNRGFSLLDDDRAVLRKGKGGLTVYGNCPRSFLEQDRHPGYDLNLWEKRETREDGKITWVPPRAVWQAHSPLRYLIHLRIGDCLSVRKEGPAKHIVPLLENVFLAAVFAENFAEEFLGLMGIIFSEADIIVCSRTLGENVMVLADALNPLMCNIASLNYVSGGVQ